MIQPSGLSKFIILLALAFLFTACEPKNEPRWTHEGAKAWSASTTPDAEDVQASSFNDFDLNKAYAQTKDSKADLTSLVLTPLSEIVLNKKFIEAPKYRTTRLSLLINVFNRAFLIEVKKPNPSAAFLKVKDAYYQTLFAGCARDLRLGCVNVELFAKDGGHTAVMTALASDLDTAIDKQLKTAKSMDDCVNANETCRNLIEERYRRLNLGVFKGNKYQDADFSFAYVKYAKLFAIFLARMKTTAQEKTADRAYSSGYLSEVHSQIFETIIAKYHAKDLNDPEFRKFVETFNPWGYSRKEAGLFQYGTGVMFGLGTQCCLYKDANKTELSESVRTAINETEKDRDSFGLSFRQMVADIKSEHGDRLFRKLGLGNLLSEIDGNNSSFYNEYFFIVDRLFRGHLSTGEIEMMLRNTNPARARTELPKMIANYVKVYLVYMVMETNRFMATIYHSNLASDEIFKEAIQRSREITGRWYTIQAQTDLLDKLMNSYFREMQLNTPEYGATFNLLKALNRNIHYLSVYPNMIVMNYFFSKMKGKVEFSFWGGSIKVDADTILKQFFDGEVTEPWFRFGKDAEALDRLMILYSLEYMLSTESMNSFVAKDSTTEGSERSKFFEVIFSKYLDDSIDEMRKSLESFKQKTLGSSTFAIAKDICDYETKGNGRLSPRLELNFLELDRYTYTGTADTGINTFLANFLGSSQDIVSKMLGQVEDRRTFVAGMVEVIEGDLLRTGAITKKGEAHPDLAKARSLLQQLDDVQADLSRIFIGNHKSFFECSVRLREIERRRANRLYDEERQHLGKIYDLMVPLASITDNRALDAKVAEINAKYFRVQGSEYKFDRLDGMNYRMSKFDLLMRMKKRIEADIFMTPTEKERRNYGASLATYLKPRAVSVFIPEGLVREELYAKATSTAISFLGTGAMDREAFIHQGMAQLNGKTNSFILWQDQMQRDLSQVNYLGALENFYLLPKVTSDPNPEQKITPEDLTKAYVEVVAGFSMDAYDMENAKEFQNYGRFPKEFFQGRLFETDGMTRLPLFYSLMVDVSKAAHISLERPASLERTVAGPVEQALDFAKKHNSLQSFVFAPSDVVNSALKDIYGAHANQRLNKVSDLYRYLVQKEASIANASVLDARLTQPLYLEGDVYYQWFQPGLKNLVDSQRLQDQRFLISNFAQRSGNFYGTREKVQSP